MACEAETDAACRGFSSDGHLIKWVSSCGFFPASRCKGPAVIPRVHTELGGDWWVEREVSSAELLAMWDVPEPLEMILLLDKKCWSLLKTCSAPLKVMEHAVDSLHAMWIRDAEKPLQQQNGNRETKGAASSCIARDVGGQSQPSWKEKDPHPDESKKSAQNPEVSLADWARQEVLSELKLKEHAASDRNAKAAKDDRAKDPTYM